MRRAKSRDKVVVFWAEHYFQLYYLLPVIKEKVAQKNSVILYTERKNILDNAPIPDEVELFYIDDLKSSVLAVLDRWIKKYFVPYDFSETYYRKFFRNKPSKSFLLLNRLLAWKSNHNRKYVRLFSFLSRVGLVKRIPFNIAELHVCTKVYYSYLLAPYAPKMISYMESWDHPQKGPYFIQSNLHYTWNNGLLEDTKYYQGDIGDITVINEIHKFRYTKQRQLSNTVNIISNELINDVKWLTENKDKYIVYPVCLSSSYHNIQPYEIELIKFIADALRAISLILYVRPYPLAPKDDLKELEDYDNIKIGKLKKIALGEEIFDQESVAHKIEVIRNAHTIVNLGTTFVLDSAYFSVPILQLNLDLSFGRIAEVSQYSHIKHFLNKKLRTVNRANFEELVDKIKDRDRSYVHYLQQFLRIRKENNSTRV